MTEVQSGLENKAGAGTPGNTEALVNELMGAFEEFKRTNDGRLQELERAGVIARVASGTRPDPTQFDPASPYYDPKSTPARPRWLLLDVQALRKTRLIGLAELREHPALAGMRVLQRGNRLSITPVEPGEWEKIVQQLLTVG